MLIPNLVLLRIGGGGGLGVRKEGGKKATPSSFSPVTSANVAIRSQNFLTFRFNLFNRLV